MHETVDDVDSQFLIRELNIASAFFVSRLEAVCFYRALLAWATNPAQRSSFAVRLHYYCK